MLVRGGTSSIGMLATQLAKKSGLTIIATTRKPDKKELLFNNGADQVLIGDGELAARIKGIYPEGVDKVLELVGTSTLKDSLHCTVPGGTVCMSGMLAEQWSVPDFAPMEYIPATVHLTIYDSGKIRVDQQSFQQFIRDAEAGLVKLTISRSFSLGEIAAAHHFMESNSAAGKIVILTEG